MPPDDEHPMQSEDVATATMDLQLPSTSGELQADGFPNASNDMSQLSTESMEEEGAGDKQTACGGSAVGRQHDATAMMEEKELKPKEMYGEETTMDEDMEEVQDTPSQISHFGETIHPTSGSAKGWEVVQDQKSGDETDAMSIEEFSFGSTGDSIGDIPLSQSNSTTMEKPFDMNLLRESIKQGERAMESIKDRDVVLVVGKTGVGKSTLIQGIAGRTFRQAMYTTELFSQTIESEVFEPNDPLPGFAVGHSKSSKTKALNVYYSYRGTAEAENPIVYIDTPGFEDTEGPEVDIATSVMLTQVAKKCRSLRFVVMINYVSLLEERGGALRSVLKFIRKFVNDFKEQQQSFVFLFTHTNQIKTMPESINGSKRELEKEVIKIIEGTTDEGVLDVLRFLRKCLGKNYPFVDIIDPLQTNFAGLASFIESRKVKSIDDPKIAASCGLTGAAQIKLSSEVQRLSYETKHLLQIGDTDIARLQELQSYFQYFSKYLSFGDVWKAVEENKELLTTYIQNLHTAVDDEISNGTNDADCVANIHRLNTSLQALCALDSKFSLQSATNRIVRHVTAFQKQVLFDIESSFSGLDAKLCKLKTWKEFAPPELNFVYDDTVSVTQRLLLKSVDAVSSIPMTEFECTGDDELAEIFLHLGKLEELVDEIARGRSLCHIDLDVALRAFRSTTGRISKILEKWDEDCDFALKTRVFDDETIVDMLKTRADRLQQMERLVDECGLRTEKLQKSGVLLRKIAVEVSQKFDVVCTNLEHTLDKFDPSWSTIMQNLHGAVSSFATFRDSAWDGLKSSFSSLVEVICGVITKKSGELDEMAFDTLKHGLRDGKRNGRALSSFESLAWFDELLPPEQRFVVNFSIAIRRKYEERGSKLKALTYEIMAEGHVGSSGGSPLRRHGELKMYISEIKQLAVFGSIVSASELVQLADNLKTEIETYASSKLESWSETAARWDRMVEDWNVVKLRELNTSLGDSLEEIAILSQLLDDWDSDVLSFLRMAQGRIRASVRSLSNQVNRDFESGDYTRMAKAYACVEAIGVHCCTSSYLPQCQQLREQARSRISSHATKIEQTIAGTSEWDEMDSLLVAFENAVVLDDMMGLDVGSRLGPLRRIRDGKEEEVDDILSNMMKTRDFTGIRGFLVPLSQSNDQVRRQKFDMCVKTVVESLREVESKLKHEAMYSQICDDSVKRINQGLDMLECAENELGEKLRQEYDVRVKIDLIKQSIWKRVEELAAKSLRAVSEFDLVTLKEQQDMLVAYSNVENHFNPRIKKRRDDSLKLCNTSLGSVPSRIDKFIDSMFKEESDLAVILSSLQRAHDSSNPNLTTLSKLYVESTTSLTERVTNIVNSYRQVVAMKESYDDSIDVLQDLECSLNRGLDRHLPSHLTSTCKELLESWKQARRERESELKFNVSNAETVLDRIADWLDKLKAPTSDPARKSWTGRLRQELSNYVHSRPYRSTAQTYRNLTSRIEKVAGNWNAKGMKALLSRDHPRLQECIYVLSLMQAKIGSHVLSAGTRLRELKSETQKEFLSFCSTVSVSLECGKSREFERSFADYRGFVLHVPFLSADANVKKKMKLVHQSLFVWMDKEVKAVLESMKTFEFHEIRERLSGTREFGGFVSDRFSLLHEEFKSHDHLETDEWLEKLQSDIIFKYFGSGRDLGGIKHFAVLEVAPSASFGVVKKAWKAKSLKLHPDKCKDPKRKEERTADFRHITEAYEALVKRFEGRYELLITEKPFDKELRAIGSHLTETVKKSLEEQHYECVAELLSKFDEICVLDDLVEPNIDSSAMKSDISRIVASHVEGTRIEIDTRWSERSYKDLNHSIVDLKMMEANFSSYPDVFDKSWNTGIVAKIEDEISALGKKARAYLSDKVTAKTHSDELRRCFLGMGAVLVELPLFKNFTRCAMCDVLEVCLASDWGYSYLFDLGLSLRKSEDADSDDDARIAHMILGQFTQFKEVLTMVWNEETIQKPVEDTVRDIQIQQLTSHAHIAGLDDVQLSLLKKKFYEFEQKYKAVLGTYLDPDADLNCLVQNVTAVADNLKPVTKDMFGESVKKEIPRLLAGVFGLFTILKSGEGYHRLEESSDESIDATKLLLKPHNIQVVTLLCLFGCENASVHQLQSQLMQIRTGEGKSMILGAAAVVLGLLGFQVRCVCYSDYLSHRDFELFREVFESFGLMEATKYSKITTFSEDMAAAKGDIRALTLSLLRGQNGTANAASATTGQLVTKSEQILLVDEVDVFFSGSFYGQTYNKVAFLKEPEINSILIEIWSVSNEGRKKVRFAHIQQMSEFSSLLRKYRGFEFCIKNEVLRMINEVRRVDDTPYYIDPTTDRIGHKVMDTVSFEVTFGYRTVFAYLKEADRLQDRSATLNRELGMLISCGQFSFANISPDAILGVSGTLQVMGEYERNVLKQYGVERFMYVPSVYGKSNFQFDKAGDGISIETSLSDYYQKITEMLIEMSRAKRAGIVFFPDTKRLTDFLGSPFYRKLGRNKSVLREDMTIADKEFVISKAATAGQLTLCSAVFGRGTDFFCKDETVESNGGVHVIQAFFSLEESEEIQIQGRTARQGKKGTFSMILLENDLNDTFGIAHGTAENWPRNERYLHLSEARKQCHIGRCATVDSSLVDATEKDLATQSYLNSLRGANIMRASKQFEAVYLSMKKSQTPAVMNLDLAFAVDNTGSMARYAAAIESTLSSMLDGSSSLAAKLADAFPVTTFNIRYAVLGYRDIDDGDKQFVEHTWNSSGSHFTDNLSHAMQVTKKLVYEASGGGDVAEDHLGAIQHCIRWNGPGDWDESSIKVVLLLTDAPAHQFVPASLTHQASDKYSIQHPAGLTVDSVVDQMVKKDIELFVGSFDPTATSAFEEDVRSTFADHKENAGVLEMVSIPLLPSNQSQRPTSDATVNNFVQRHIIFVLDESGSMNGNWSGVEVAYNNYVARRRQQQLESDLVSVVQFDANARKTVSLESIVNAPTSLGFRGGGTCFSPAAACARDLGLQTPRSHQPLVVFMSDGGTEHADASAAATTFATLNQEVLSRHWSELELHVIAFGSANSVQLQSIASASSKGQLHSAASVNDLSNVFVQIAGGGENIASVLKEEIGKRVLDAVSDRIVAEYSG